ncbi:MAG: cobalt ECF transporter T component CbiQ [Chloroflexi bacterium]|nr:cobalt ECF transporter T component CbiQ [Chloroflexota bacterium]
MLQSTSEAPLVHPKSKRKRRQGFIERTVRSLADVLEQALFAEEVAKADGLLQSIDPRVKVVGLLLLVVATASAHSLSIILALFALALALALLSHVPIRRLATRVWIGVLFFTGSIALPAIFITPGVALVHVPLLHWPITAQGIKAALYLLTRVETATTLSVLLVLCTPWNQVLKALRVLRVPVVFVVILGMTYRYIFVLLQTAADMFESRQSRLVGRLDGQEQRRLAAASVGVLLGKSLQLSSDIYLAMLARGYRGEVYTLDDFKAQPRDWLALGGFVIVALFAFWFGR